MKKLWKYTSIVYPILAAFVMFWFGALYGKSLVASQELSIIEMLGHVVVYAGAILGGILVHEAGHLVGGLLSGYTFSSFRIGKWMWYKEGEKIKFALFTIPGTLGQCLMIPAKRKDDYPYFWYLAGGGMANLLFGLTSALLTVVVMQEMHIFLWINAGVNLGLGLLNLLPYKGFVSNDGYQLVSLFHNRKARKAFALQLMVADAQIHGRRLIELEESAFVYATEKDYENEIIAVSQFYLIGRELDRKNYEKAYQMMKQLLAKEHLEMSELLKQIIRLEILYLDLVHHRLTDVSHQYSKKLKKLTKSLASSHLAACRFLYAYEKIVHQKDTEAEAYVQQFEKIAIHYPYKGDLALERELLALAQKD